MNLTIGKKLTGGVIILLILVSAGIGIMSYIQGYNAIHNQLETNAPQIATYGSMVIRRTLDKHLATVTELAQNPEIKSMDWERQQPVIQKAVERLGYFQIGVASLDGHTYLNDSSEAQIADRTYFKRATTGETVVSDIVIHKVLQIPVQVFATPIRDLEDEITGIVFVVLDATWLSETTDKIKYGEHGYSYIIDGTGVTIAHPNRDDVLNQRNLIKESEKNPKLNSVATMFKKMISGETGFYSYSYEGTSRIFGYTSIPGTSWSIAAGSAEKDVFKEVYRTRLNIIILSLIFVIIGAVLIILFSRSIITHPINKLAQVISDVAKGKLHIERVHRKAKDDIGILADSTNTMIDFLIERNQIMKNIASGNVNLKVRLASKDDEVGKALKTMVNSLRNRIILMDKISNGNLTEQVRSLSNKDSFGMALNKMVFNLNKIINDILTNSSQVAYGSQELSQAVSQIAEGATAQANSVSQTSESMKEMASSIETNLENVEKTESIATKVSEDAYKSVEAVLQAISSMKGIAEKINVIEEIARKTELLALNAAVEAARAGEQGKGFSVVASEIGKLAESSQESANEISQFSSNGMQIAEKASEMLKQLVPEILKTKDLVQGIARSTEEQNASSTKINTAMQKLDDIIHQNAAAAEQMAATSSTLSESADNLKKTVEFFKIKKKLGSKETSDSQPEYDSDFLQIPGLKEDREDTNDETLADEDIEDFDDNEDKSNKLTAYEPDEDYF